MPLNSRTRLVVSDNQVSADITPSGEGEVVILGLKDGIYFELNDVGARIWRLIQAPTTIAEIVAALLEEYDVTREQCEADVCSIASELIDRDLARISDAQGS